MHYLRNLRKELTKPLRGWDLAWQLTFSAALLTGMTILGALRPTWVEPALLALLLLCAIAVGTMELLRRLLLRRIASRVQKRLRLETRT